MSEARTITDGLPGRQGFFAWLLPRFMGLYFAVGLGFLLQSAGDGHVHVTGGDLTRHHHAYVGAHDHSAGSPMHSHDGGAPHEHGTVPATGHDHDHESGESETQTGFFAAAAMAHLAPGLPSGLPVSPDVSYLRFSSVSSPPIAELVSQARPRAPPARLSLDAHRRVV